jgi:hypothetical protein
LTPDSDDVLAPVAGNRVSDEAAFLDFGLPAVNKPAHRTKAADQKQLAGVAMKRTVAYKAIEG